MRAFPRRPRSAAARRLRRAALLLLASIPLALLLSVLISGGQARSELPSPRAAALLGCYLWIFAALVGLGLPLRRLTALREAERQALIRGLVADLLYSEDAALFSVVFHPGCGEARCQLKRTDDGFCAVEEDLGADGWTPTGRAWRAGTEPELWTLLDGEGYTEIAWYEERKEGEA